MGVEVEQPWEALDVDDSDLPSLLRHCKHHKTTPTIPGPAGAVKSAMLCKTIDRQHLNSGNGDLLSTQEYVRKAVEDTIEFDDDFTGLPWLSALQYLGVGEGVIPSTPISSIKKCTDVGEADQVVAVIKSCRPTGGLGGMMVTLKDPTGTVGASIHHKVLCDTEFRKNITVGSVLILKKAAIFSPVRSAQYINVTLRNLVKVFGQGADPSSKQDYADNPSHTENPEKANTLEVSTTESTEMEDTRLDKGKEQLVQKQNLFAKLDNRTSSNLTAGVKRGYSELSQDTGLEASQGEHIAAQHEPVFVSDKCAEADISNNIHPVANSVVNNGNAPESQGTSEVHVERQPLISKASLPEWTDEQLEELFADDDDGSLFS